MIDKKEVVKVAVMEGSFQNELYRTLEMKDQKKRNSIQIRLLENEERIKKNQGNLNEKKVKNQEKYNKHLQEVYKRYKSRQK